jgi:L-ascorbate metabolism protein UlaG (beta-lactamase superfamily)
MTNIQSDTNLQQFYRAGEEANGLFYMGHASILCMFGGKKILFDPVILSQPYSDSWIFYPPQVRDSVVFDVDAVVVSHIHQDHYDLEFLKALDGKAKIIVIGGRPSFENDLHVNKIKNLHIVTPETVTEIFDDVFMFGVLHESNGIDASAIVFNDVFCIYHGNDNYLKPASMEKFTKVRPKIDVACIPYAYIHWYPFLMEYETQQAVEKVREAERLVNLYMNDCVAATRILNPQLVIPFGANLLLDDGDGYSVMNLSVKTPIEFCEYVACVNPDISNVIKPMLSGDYCLIQEGALDITINQDLDGSSYRAEANAFLQNRPVKQPDSNWKAIDRGQFIDALNGKIQKLTERLDNIIRIKLDYLGEMLMVEIDCNVCVARWVNEFKDGVPYHQYNLDKIASGLWLNGQRFEEILGTRRFSVKREPNIYDPKVLRVTTTLI